jgi:hypothetical protein
MDEKNSTLQVLIANERDDRLDLVTETVVDEPVVAVDDVAVDKTDAPAIETTEETRARLERDADDK